MKPIQVWLPTIFTSLGFSEICRDAQRTFKEWRGELVIWLLPWIRKPIRWIEYDHTRGFRYSVLAVPAEHLDRLDVYHIGANGGVFGIFKGYAQFPSFQLEEKLLETWLNANVSFLLAPKSVDLEVPKITKDEISYKRVKLDLEPGPAFPITGVDKNNRTVTMEWPPGDDWPEPSFSPAAESHEFYGPREQKSYKGPPLAIGQKEEDVSLHTVAKWSDPIAELIPSGGCWDDLAAQASMAEIAKTSTNDLQTALQEAKSFAAPYLTDGETTLRDVRFWPTLVKEGMDAILFRADDLGLPGFSSGDKADREKVIGDLDKAYRSPEWRKYLKQPVPIRRAWGVVGLFWALLIDRLEENRNFLVCERCGRFLGGKKDKRFCGPKDDRACFNTRRADDKRRSRENKPAR